MPFLVDTDVLVDVSRNHPGAIAFVDLLDSDWAISAMTALELISGARDQKEVQLIDRLIAVYETIPAKDAIGLACIRFVAKICETGRPADVRFAHCGDGT